jgi:hypothetical protein
MQKLARWAKRKKLAQWTKRILWIGVGAILVAEAIALLISQPAWTGFGPDSTKNIERDSTGKITKIVEVGQSGKTLWDLMSVLGVPFALTVLGFLFQQREQKRVDEQAKLEREIALANQREEALQVYFDRLSTLLIDKNLIAIATRVKTATATDEDKELLNAAVDVIRARTLSILRQFGEDGERKSSVIQFLIEAEVIDKLNLNLSRANLICVNLLGADLSCTNLLNAKLSRATLIGSTLIDADLNHAILIDADLRHAILFDAKLSHAKLNHAALIDADLRFANLCFANLSDADLSDADLSDADLRDADLSNTNLCGANLSGTNLSGANLHGANLSEAKGLKPEQLDRALLCGTQLPEGWKLDPDRDCKALEKELGIKKSD